MTSYKFEARNDCRIIKVVILSANSSNDYILIAKLVISFEFCKQKNQKLQVQSDFGVGGLRDRSLTRFISLFNPNNTITAHSLRDAGEWAVINVLYSCFSCDILYLPDVIGLKESCK